MTIQIEGIIVNSLCFRYEDRLIINNLDLQLPANKIFCIVGPSGCGKSTLLRLIAQLEYPLSGEIKFDNKKTHNNLRFLFQDYDAFPWYTVLENLQQSYQKYSVNLDPDIKNILELVGLWESRDKYPTQLSGGMKKRLALARNIILKPSILLLDEPFSKLDIDIRNEMYSLFQDMWLDLNQTVILVTHDLHEAILLGTQVLVSTHNQLRISDVIDIPFEYPRIDTIIDAPMYSNIMKRIRKSLRG
jgi:ABC-type nitrate/sulfonate/bicarbonate transport system ATPase subunit